MTKLKKKSNSRPRTPEEVSAWVIAEGAKFQREFAGLFQRSQDKYWEWAEGLPEKKQRTKKRTR